MIRVAILLAALALLAGCSADAGLRETTRGDLIYATGGEGAGRVTVIRRADAEPPYPTVLFLHGWGATEPRFYGPWLEHLAREGNAVVYPRYQQSVAELPAQVLGNTQVGIRLAFDGLDLARDGVVVAGHSAGGALAADYAAIAAGAGLPAPRAVLSMYPGRAFRGIDIGIPSAGPVPAGVTLQVLTGARDRVVDPRDAQAIVRDARTDDRRLVLVRAAGAADHLGPQRDTPVARRVFWARLDRMIADARR